MENNLRTKILQYEKQLGTIASLMAIIMFFSLIEILLSNIRGTSNIIIQPAATAVTGLLWSFYAYAKKDWFILLPNIIAFSLGIITAVAGLT